MNDKELADAVVALGVGRLSKIAENGYQFEVTTNIAIEDFVRDWRVAGNLLEVYSVRFPERDLLTLHMPIQAREIIEDITEALS